jgi:hypothetical protein
LRNKEQESTLILPEHDDDDFLTLYFHLIQYNAPKGHVSSSQKWCLSRSSIQNVTHNSFESEPTLPRNFKGDVLKYMHFYAQMAYAIYFIALLEIEIKKFKYR